MFNREHDEINERLISLEKQQNRIEINQGRILELLHEMDRKILKPKLKDTLEVTDRW